MLSARDEKDQAPNKLPRSERRSAREGGTNQRIRDLAFLLPFIGLLLFSPLMLTIVKGKTLFWGLPSLPLFVFCVWIALIIACKRLGRNLTIEPVDMLQQANMNTGEKEEDPEFEVKP